MKKVIITGAAGFVGFHLARTLNDRGGYDLTLVDNLERGRQDEAFQALLDSQHVRFIQADLTDSSAFEAFPSDVQYVYHLAAVIGVKNVMEHPDRVLYVNAVSTLNLFEWAKGCSGLKKILFSSTSEIYSGTLRHFGIEIPTAEGTPLTVADIADERTTYALSKMYGESICHNYGRKFEIPTTIVRYHNVYGPRMGYRHVIPEMFVKIENDAEIEVASPAHTRAFCFVDDAVEMTILLCEHEAAAGETFHVGNQEQEIAIRELVQEVARVMKKPISIQEMPDTPGSPTRRCPDTSKSQAVTGFVPRFNLARGLQLTYNWYRERLEDQYE